MTESSSGRAGSDHGYPRCPWNKSKLKGLGKSIRDSTELPAGAPTYAEAMSWYNKLVGEAQRFLVESDWEPLLGPVEPSITGRPKTEQTLREKLQRQPSYPLPSIQDVAGVRFEADMRLDQQDAVVQAIVAHNADRGVEADIHDRRDGDHAGYRAVHIVLRPEGACPIEVQVRTGLQGQWANMYEALADKIGRNIRYGDVPIDPLLAEIIKIVQVTSMDIIASFEQQSVKAFKLRQDAAQLGWFLGFTPRIRLRQFERNHEDLRTTMQAQLERMRKQIVEGIPRREWAMLNDEGKGSKPCPDS